MKKILFLPKYTETGASSRYRTYQYIKHFSSAGFHCTLKPLFNDKHISRINSSRRGVDLSFLISMLKRTILLFSIKKFNFVFIEKEAMPYFPGFFEFILQILNMHYILDFDDAIFHNYDQSRNPIIRLLLKRKIPRIIKRSSHVICGSKYLADYCREFNSNIILIPTVVPANKYTPSSHASEEFIIGWIGSFYTSRALLLILPALRNFASKHSCRIKLIGVNKVVFEAFKDLPAERVTWSVENEYNVLPTFDIGIAPLHDTPFNRGKCAFKIIQYMANGCAIICTPVGANGEAVLHGKTGYHAVTTADWERYLSELFEDRLKLTNFKKNSRIHFEETYSLEGALPKYLQIFNGLAK